MGHRKDWDMNAIRHQIWAMRHEATTPYNDGWMQFDIKQDLYRLKWQIDEALAACSSFAGENEWLHEVEQERIINILKS
jgi:hypothetical protein